MPKEVSKFSKDMFWVWVLDYSHVSTEKIIKNLNGVKWSWGQGAENADTVIMLHYIALYV